VQQQKLDLLHCQSKLNRISHASAQGAEINSVAWKREKEIEKGGVVGENKRVRGPVSECEREREKGKRRVKTVRKKEKESCHGAQEPLL